MNFSSTISKSFLQRMAAILGLSIFAISGNIAAYDTPDFSYHLFSPDGLFLEESEKANLLQALSALGSDYSGHKEIDSDIKEKAIALALMISPFHETSRNAHELLLKEGAALPSPPPRFAKPETIADILWETSGKMLSGKAEPEAEKLALYLMDIALTLYRTPPPERLKQFARLTNLQLLPWEKFVTLQPNSNSSSRRIGIMFSLLKMEQSTTGKKQAPVRKPATVSPPKASQPRGPELKLKFASIPAIGFSNVANTVGILHLSIKPWEDEKNTPSASGGKPAPEIHLDEAFRKGGVHLAGFKEITTLVRSRYQDWPSQSLAMFAFDPSGDTPVLPTEEKANMSLPGILLLHSAYSGKKIGHSMVFAGQLAPIADKELPGIVPAGSSAELFEKAKLIKIPFLALPMSAHKILLGRAVASRSLGHLIKPQLLSFSDLDDAIKLAMDEPEEPRAQAEAAFQEIVAVSSQMSLEGLAENKSIRKRLQKILDAYPRHLSTRIMLDFGKAISGN